MTDSTAVATRVNGTGIQDLARADFNPEQVELIKATVAKDCSNAELAMFLELAGRYQLDPFAKEIWAVKIPGKDGNAGRMSIFTARDGFLKIAQRSEDYEGMTGDVVWANDSFEKHNGEPEPHHSYGIERGEQCMGAWATVYRKNRKPTYFFAPFNEYVPNEERKKKTPWGKQASAMILKCAEATALRKAFSITGLVGEEEMAHTQAQIEESVGTIDWGEDPSLAAWLPGLFDACNAIQPDSFRDPKIRMMMRGIDDEARELIAQQLVEFIEQREGTVPERPEILEGSAIEEDEPTGDGEPVAEGEHDVSDMFPAVGDPDVQRGE